MLKYLFKLIGDSVEELYEIRLVNMICTII